MFVVKIPVKPYVKKYLEINYGSPAKLNRTSNLHNYFLTLLEKQLFECQMIATFGHYTESIEIEISSDTFYRNGWGLSKSNIIRFNREVEDKVKFQSRFYIGFHSSLGIHVHKCIRNFQEIFGYSEDIYPFATIKKDYQRHGTSDTKEKFNQVSSLIQNLFLENVSLIRDSTL